jgi:hypothetical protein
MSVGVTRGLLYDDAKTVQSVALRHPDEGRNDVLPCGQLRSNVRPISDSVGLKADRSLALAAFVRRQDAGIPVLLQMIPPADPVGRNAQRVEPLTSVANVRVESAGTVSASSLTRTPTASTLAPPPPELQQ